MPGPSTMSTFSFLASFAIDFPNKVNISLFQLEAAQLAVGKQVAIILSLMSE